MPTDAGATEPVPAAKCPGRSVEFRQVDAG
jgi:hypothetical protein